MWYYLDSATWKGETMIEPDSKNPELYEFFVLNKDSKIMNYIRLRAKGQRGLTGKMLESLDYLQPLGWNIPVFSNRFVDKLSDSLRNCLGFYPCSIYNKTGGEYEFYFGRILNILPVIDEEKSGYRLLTDGSKIIDEPVIIRQEIDESLLMVRDLNEPATPVVSSLFKQMVEENNLKIKFRDTSCTFF